MERSGWSCHYHGMPTSEAAPPVDPSGAEPPRRGRSGRLAVVIVHGIGEQHPTTTLRAFADAVLARPRGPGKTRYFVKPEARSELLDLRRIVVPADGDAPTTHLFEIYWAHLIRDTRFHHVVGWLWNVLFRSPRKIPSRILRVYWLAWTLVMFALAAAVLGSLLDLPIGVKLVLYALAPLCSYVALQWLGDAARYLIPSPDNIAARQAIRVAGLRLLRRLHEGDRYDRIVVVGHSLGSVIAYDLLACYWAECHKVHGRPETVSQPVLEGFGARWANGNCGDLQHELLVEQQRHGFGWRISDFITLGSPLSHATLLLADGPDEFELGKTELSMPTCPPRLDGESFVYEPKDDGNRPGGRTNVKLMHHAALFACTRWHNYYFRNDLVGGPLKPVLGEGIDDREIRYAGPRAWLRGKLPLMSHTHYWLDSPENPSRALLRSAIAGKSPVGPRS